MNYYGFIYEWIDSTNGKNYLGSHKGLIDDGYIGSGTLFLRAFKKRPYDFTREIIEYVYEDDRKVLLEREQKYLDLIDWSNTYNLLSFVSGGSMKGWKHTKEAKKKQSKIKLGKTHTEETKQIMSEKAKGNTNSKKGKIPWNKGLKTGPLSEDHKRKVSKGLKGISKSEEHKQNMKDRVPWNKGITWKKNK